MNRTATTLATFALLLVGASAAARNVDLSTLPGRDSVQLTIYNSEDLTLVKETRFVTFKKGAFAGIGLQMGTLGHNHKVNKIFYGKKISNAEILYDNMKNVVIGRKDGKPLFNTEFLHFAYHYGFQPKPCPAYSPWVKGKVERPMNYIRERFWRGYPFESLNRANRDIITWLNETANKRIHGTHRQAVNQCWEQEIPSLGKLPPMDYDTSIKVFRKVYKDCQISYNGNRYVVPYHVVGKNVMLKIKHNLIRIYHDHEFLASYNEPVQKNTLMSNPSFYEQLKRDKEQLGRKYSGKKGKATAENAEIAENTSLILSSPRKRGHLSISKIPIHRE